MDVLQIQLYTMYALTACWFAFVIIMIRMPRPQKGAEAKREPLAWLAIPLYIAGTLLRIHLEEKLLRQAFSLEYEAFAARTRRFIPFIY